MTNHAQEALGALSKSRDWLEDEEFAHADLAAKRAQVHATLALAEQQRIANLITLSNAEQADYLTQPITEEEQQKLLEDYGAFSHLAPITRLRPEIREALELGGPK